MIIILLLVLSVLSLNSNFNPNAKIGFNFEAGMTEEFLAPPLETKKKGAEYLRQSMDLLVMEPEEFATLLGERVGRYRRGYSIKTLWGFLRPNSGSKILPKHIRATRSLIEIYGPERIEAILDLLGMDLRDNQTQDLLGMKDGIYSPVSRRNLQLLAKLIKRKTPERLEEIKDLLWMDIDEFGNVLGEAVRGDGYSADWVRRVLGFRHDFRSLDQYLKYLRIAREILISEGQAILEEIRLFFGMDQISFNKRIEEKEIEGRLRAARKMVELEGPVQLRKLQKSLKRFGINDPTFAKMLGEGVRGRPYGRSMVDHLMTGRRPLQRNHLKVANKIFKIFEKQRLEQLGVDFEVGGSVVYMGIWRGKVTSIESDGIWMALPDEVDPEEKMSEEIIDPGRIWVPLYRVHKITKGDIFSEQL